MSCGACLSIKRVLNVCIVLLLCFPAVCLKCWHVRMREQRDRAKAWRCDQQTPPSPPNPSIALFWPVLPASCCSGGCGELSPNGQLSFSCRPLTVLMRAYVNKDNTIPLLSHFSWSDLESFPAAWATLVWDSLSYLAHLRGPVSSVSGRWLMSGTGHSLL